MRAKFSRLLTDAALADKKILLLTGDHGYALFDEFRQECPDQFINCGIAEQNMVGVAAGLAKAGFKPIVYGLAAFVPIRVLEQIKMDICYEPLPVILIGDGAGIVYGQLGPSHQSTEDIAAVRPLPNLNIFSPCDIFELEYCFDKMIKSKLPSYFRFGKADLGNIHVKTLNVAIGDLIPVIESKSEKVIFATGSMVSVAVKAVKDYPEISVWSIPSLAPINKSQINEITKNTKTILVLEEHSVNGGLGGLITETVTEEKRSAPIQVIRVGIQNKFSDVCGSYDYLMERHGLGLDNIKTIIKNH